MGWWNRNQKTVILAISPTRSVRCGEKKAGQQLFRFSCVDGALCSGLAGN
jgi:hypothetical protein